MEIASLGVVFTFAFICESLTEYLFSDLFAALGIDGRYLRYTASLVGVILCLAYGLDIVGDALGIAPRVPYLGEVLTGLMLGRGANYVHDFYTRYMVKKEKGRG